MKLVTAGQLLTKAFVYSDEQARYALAEKISSLIYPKFKFSEFGRDFLSDENFIRTYELFDKENYHSLDRKYLLDQVLKLTQSVEGDTVESGAFQGASSYLICKRMTGYNKTHHIFDSFDGLSEPDNNDGEYWTTGNLASTESIIKENLKEFPFVKYYKGWIPERFPEVAHLRFCFVHIDVDLYKPTRDTIQFFYERLNRRGIMICDDYGFETCPGAQKAMDEFFDDKAEPIIRLPTGQGLVIKQ